MTMTDPVADMLTRIRNATAGHRPRVDIPQSRLKAEIARILQSEGYIQGFKLVPKSKTVSNKSKVSVWQFLREIVFIVSPVYG